MSLYFPHESWQSLVSLKKNTATCIKRFLQTGWRAETWFTKFTGGYRALYTCTKRFLQTVVGTQQKFIIHDSRAATALSTHAQNACKKNCLGREVRHRREKIEIQGLKQSFLMWKTWKMVQKVVKNSSKIAPKARKFWGFWDTVFILPPLRIPWSDNKGGG